MKVVLLFLLLLTSLWAFAEPDPRLQQLEAAYSRVQQEQQSVYQQFLMTQELRRNEMQDTSQMTLQNNAVMGIDSTRPIDYDENVRKQRAKQERLNRYEQEISQSYARFLELGEQKKVLLDQILELSKPTGR